MFQSSIAASFVAVGVAIAILFVSLVAYASSSGVGIDTIEDHEKGAQGYESDSRRVGYHPGGTYLLFYSGSSVRGSGDHMGGGPGMGK